jgi:predicted O-methyltransferase YrrM
MKALQEALDLFSRAGIEVTGGLNPDHFDGGEAKRIQFMEAIRLQDKFVLDSGGISPFEVALLEGLAQNIESPKNIFIVGNAWGWSAVVFHFLFPSARIVTIDALIGGESARVTNEIFQEIIKTENLPIKSKIGFSPNDVESVVKNSFVDFFDFVFIDGDHTNAQVIKDFHAIVPFTNETSTFLFHDVLSWDLTESFNSISSEMKFFSSKILHRTTSGFGILYPPNVSIDKYLSYFSESTDALSNIRARQLATKRITWKIAFLLDSILPRAVYFQLRRLKRLLTF